MRFFIIIPTRNRKDILSKMLSSLFKQSTNNFSVFVIDDGSTDGTADILRKEFPDVVVLRGDGDLWWTGAINKGIKFVLPTLTDDDYILTLNDDLELPRDYLRKLELIAKKNPRSLIGSISMDISDRSTIVHAGIKIKWKFFYKKEVLHYQNLELKDIPELYSVDSLTGRGTLIPKKTFEIIGLFDEKTFPHYAADEDFAMRAKKKGFNLYLSRNVYLYSYVSLTGEHAAKYKNIKSYYKNLFSRKSSNNIIYSNKLLLRHCPSKYVVSNLLYSNLKRLIYPFARIIQ